MGSRGAAEELHGVRDHGEHRRERLTDPSGLPGRFTISAAPRAPAIPRESAAIGVCDSPVARISSASPGASRSMTARVASGVTSRGPNPVPPVVTTSPFVDASSRSADSISACSSATTRRSDTSKPAARSNASAASPEASSRVPWVTPSETVRTAARVVPGSTVGA